MPQYHTDKHGFTVVELMVAVGVAVILMFIVHQVFYASAETLRQGAALSKVIGASRSVNELLANDFDAMVPQSQDGVLVILSRQIIDVNMKTRPTDPDILPGDFYKKESLRDDQIVFARDRAGIQPLCPNTTSSFYSSASSPRVLIWIGHGLRTEPSGWVAGTPLGALGPNEIGTNWALARHAMFLGGLTPATGIYINGTGGVQYNAEIVHTGLAAGPPHPPSPRRYMGFADYSPSTYLDTVIYDLAGSTSADDYAIRAYEYTFGKNRLWINPNPEGPNFASWQIGQMHALLANNVSDFEIAFAGDYRDNTNPYTPPYVPDGELDATRKNPSFPNEDKDKSGTDYRMSETIIWYDHHSSVFNDPSTPASFDSTQPVSYSIPQGEGAFNDPGNPTAPIYDDDPNSLPPNADAAFVWRHDDAYLWPWLIRIRYRIHDSNGVLVSGDKHQTGRWFELVLKVNRD